MTYNPPKKPTPEFACLGCGCTLDSIIAMGLNRHMGVVIAGSSQLMPICSACEEDTGKMIAVLASYIEPAPHRRQREIETVLWRVHNSAVASLKKDLDIGHAVMSLHEVERRTREQLSMIQRLEEQAKRVPSLSAIVSTTVRGWLDRIVRRVS
jgi:hypothetical protein